MSRTGEELNLCTSYGNSLNTSTTLLGCTDQSTWLRTHQDHVNFTSYVHLVPGDLQTSQEGGQHVMSVFSLANSLTSSTSVRYLHRTYQADDSKVARYQAILSH
jgi:hypothetical protein